MRDCQVTSDLDGTSTGWSHTRRDLDAVRNGLTLPHSSGPVEGNINRLKMIKRQMFGRASLDLPPQTRPTRALNASHNRRQSPHPSR